LILLAGASIVITSCQDDPELEPVAGDEDFNPNKTAAYITGYRINSYPSLDPTGNLWDTPDTTIIPSDPNGLPDLMLNISDVYPDPPVFWAQESHFANVGQFDSVSFILIEPFKVEILDSYFKMNIYDFELPDSTLMGFVTLYVGEYPDPNNPYPESVLIQENGLSVTVGLSWED
jgi:hypothetical protein